MGTNYYAEVTCPDPCAHCQPQRLHICKSLTSFRGHTDTMFGDIGSWAAWRNVLLTGAVSVVDEYGVYVPVQEFIAGVEAMAPEARRRQYDFMHHEFLDTHTGFLFPEWQRDYWLDPDGFTFTYREFS